MHDRKGRVGDPLIERALYWLRLELRNAEAAPADHVLFGSVVLYLHGLRQAIGDIDVFVTPPVWDRLTQSVAWEPKEPRPDDPPFLASVTTPSISAFYDWTQRDEWIDVPECFARSEIVEGWRAIPLELVRDQKRSAGAAQGFDGPRAKHIDDLRLLDYVLS